MCSRLLLYVHQYFPFSLFSMNFSFYHMKIYINSVKGSRHCWERVRIRSFLVRIFPLWTEYGDMLSISLYSVRMRENTDQKKLRLRTHFAQCSLLNIGGTKRLISPHVLE